MPATQPLLPEPLALDRVCRAQLTADGALPMFGEPSVAITACLTPAGEELVSSTIAAAPTRAQITQTEHRERLFYLIACLVMIAGVAIGFRMFTCTA